MNTLAFRQARDQVQAFSDFSGDGFQLGGESATPSRRTELEDGLRLGIQALRWIVRADEIVRGVLYQQAGDSEGAGQMLEDLNRFLGCWVEQVPAARAMIERARRSGEAVDGAEEFLKCAAEAEAALRVWSGSAHRAGESLAMLCEQAMEEYRRGETASFL